MNMIEASKKYTLTEIIKEVKLFILTGPTCLGWIFGILNYPLNSDFFKLAIQNGLSSLVFASTYGFFYTIHLFFHIPSENILLFLESFLSLAYVGTTLFCYLAFRQNEKIIGLKIVQSLLDRVFLFKNE
jgi:hypothetical protein